MFGGDVLVRELRNFFLADIKHALDTRRDKDLLPATRAVDAGPRVLPQQPVQSVGQLRGIRAHFGQHRGNSALLLLDQRQQQVFHVHLTVTVARHQFDRPLGRFLRALGKTIKTHVHSRLPPTLRPIRKQLHSFQRVLNVKSSKEIRCRFMTTP